MIYGTGRALLIAGTICAAGWGNQASAETINLSIGAGHPAAPSWIAAVTDIFMPRVSERVAEETDYEISWSTAWGGSVCRLNECLDSVATGLLDMGSLAVPFEPVKLMAHNFTYYVPFGTGDPVLGSEISARVYEEVPRLKEMLEEDYNQIFLGAGVISNYGLVTNFTWDTIDELEGRRIAAAGPNIPWVTAVGIVPVQSNLNEAYTSMQTGVYDGWVMYPDGITSFRLNEVAAQYTITDFGMISATPLTINKDVWESLPEEVRNIMREVGEEWIHLSGEFTAEVADAALAQMRTQGLRIKELTAEEKQEWASRLPNIPRERYEEINQRGQPGEAVYRYIDLLIEAGHEFPRDWSAER